MPQIFSEDIAQTKNILKRYGSDSLSYFHLQEKRRYFTSPSGKSFISFKLHNKVAIISSDPVGPKYEIEKLTKSFLSFLKTWGMKPCFIGTSQEYSLILRGLNFYVHKIGEEAIIDLESFDNELLKKKVRRAVRHIEELNVDFFIASPSQLTPLLYDQIFAVSKEWLTKKGKKERGFSMTLGRVPNLSDEDCKIALAVKEGNVLGFLSFTPIYKNESYSLDFTRNRKFSPNGLNEFLIVKSLKYFKENNIKKVSLNFVTFVDTSGMRKSSKNTIVKLIFKLFGKVYNSKNIQKFNQKFHPEWISRHIAYYSRRNITQYITAVLKMER